MSDLLAQVSKLDPQLGSDLDDEVQALSGRRAFGLNFERHKPEAVELPGRTVRRGDKVRILPPRDGSAADGRLWSVVSVAADRTGAEIVCLDADSSGESASVPLSELVVVAEFRDPIYPGLVSTGRVERGASDKPFHTVINAENYHALEALAWTHEGRIDAIYIDPPYNTGAKDWKYNNDYVDGEDLYRHSKWLAFMERRLKLAKRLLNAESSVLIVTIDEKEHLRLGLLLQQLFPEARHQMVTVVINPSGTSGEGFSRVDEYAYFVYVGTGRPNAWTDNMLTDVENDGRVVGGLSWESFLRSGRGNDRAARPNLCYPIAIDPCSQRVVSVGEPLVGDDHERPIELNGCELAWPVRSDGTLGIWRREAGALRSLLEAGYAHVARRDQRRGTWSLKYLLSGTIARIDSGELTIVGRGAAGEVLVAEDQTRRRVAKTVWNRVQHNAGKSGTDLLRALVPVNNFDFPKSLYAVEDALRFFVADKPNAVVLDFFAGSGTTAHAVMRLNKQDGGHRQCISVTNNEVSADEQKALRNKGLRPGDPEWEALGICDYITKPRIQAAITGLTPDGEPIKGDYKFTDEFPMADGFEENAEFFTLTYEAPLSVRHGRSFKAIAPLLWMRAGSQGRRIDEPSDDFDVADTYAVLFDLDYSREFIRAIGARAGLDTTARDAVTRPPTSDDFGTPLRGSPISPLRMAFIVTDDDRGFQQVVAELPEGIEPVRLYSSYLANFSFTGEVE